MFFFINTGTLLECDTNGEQDAFIEEDMYAAMDIDN